MTGVLRIEAPRDSGPGSGHDDSADVDVWLSSVEPKKDSDACHDLLDDAERVRAERYHFERDRLRYVNRRAFVRSVLAHYLGIEPAMVRIRTSQHGRPELDAASDLVFNASHSEGLTAVALTSGRSVGVDIERLRHVEGALELARGLFRPCELEAVRSAPTAQRSAVFLAFWTRKESYVKAVGRGLSIPLDTFDVTSVVDGVLRPRASSGLLPFAAAEFTHEGYVGAVTLAGEYVRPRVWLREAA